VENVRIPAHKAVLAAASDVFERMFTDSLEAKTGVVEVTDLSVEAVSPLGVAGG
jgi:BTB/POZ domain